MPKVCMLHRNLKMAMAGSGYSQNDLAKVMGHSKTYVSFRMSSKASWTMDDVYKICDVLEIPYTQISEYFPPSNKKVVQGNVG